MKEIAYKSEQNRLHPLGEKIFLDRYSLKDMERITFEVGDIVLIQTDTEKSNREVGHIKELFENNGVQWATIIIGEDEFKKPISQVDKPLETPEEVMDRMAKGAASVESTAEERKLWEKEFRWALDGYKLVPAGRNWTTLGTDQELSAINCIVIESPHDSRSGIYDNIKLMCELHSRGSGVGINLSSLRPRFSYVKGVNGRSSGAVSWAEMYSKSTLITEQSGSRRGATMAILNDWHPDIEEFISSKKDMSRLNGCNISVGISDRFMDAVKNDEEWELIFPDTSDPKYDEEWDGSIDKWTANGHSFIVHKVIRARELWKQITEAAWESAEPGLWFKDRANYWSATKYYDELICTNPCGEQGLGAFSVCNLLHINLSTIVKNGKIDYDLLKRLTEDAVRFGDNVIDAGKYHEPRVEKKQKAERRIGIGTLGLAEMLIKLRVRYGSPESISIIDDVYSTIKNTAYKTSALIADAKGVFHNYSRDVTKTPFIQSLDEEAWLAINTHGLRNCDLLTSAPCGTISTMVNTSGGIEPYFALEWERQSRVGRFKEGCRPYFEWKEKNEMYCRDHIGNALPDYFVTAMELSPKEHVDVMAACQKHISNSQSKTVNCPTDWTVDQVAELYMYMYDAGCKGGTIYRDKSRDEQVLHLIEEKEEEGEENENNFEKPDVEQLMHETAEIIEKNNNCYERIIGPIRDGRTISIGSPAGTCHINLNVDYNDEPCEMYVSIGKAGSDVLAFTEALARIVSYALTLESPVMPTERLNAIIEQLSGIGGSISYGFGQKKVSSVPDAIAKGLKMLQEENVDVTQEEIDFIMGNDDSFYDLPPMTSVGDLCPSCGALSLVRGAGCSSCQECGYSAC